MDFITLLLLAVGLAADAFAVSITNGMCGNHIHIKHAFATGITFGCFQAFMPVLGYLLGKSFFEFIHLYQRWAALFLLGAIGINMIADAVRNQHSSSEAERESVFTVKKLMLQGTATSIDAMAAGLSFAVLDMQILTPVLLIGTITFLFCFTGVFIGKMFGEIFGNRARFIGGILLIGIGIQIFIAGS